MNEIITSSHEEHCISHAGYEFNLRSRNWHISKDNHVYLSWVDEVFDAPIKQSFLQIIKYYAERSSSGYASNLSDRFRAFARYVFKNRGLIKEVTACDLVNYRSILDCEHEWYLGTIRVLLNKWLELGYYGLEENIKELLDNWQLKGCIKGRAVQILCPKKGPLSDLEFEGLHQGLVDAFEEGVISIENFALAQLFIATGRRPIQIADLKIKDLIVARSQDGLEEFILNVPRRKQRASVWRQEFKAFALTKEIGLLLEVLIKDTKVRLQNVIHDLQPSSIVEFPIFPKWSAIEARNKNDKKNDIQLIVQTPEFHRPTYELSEILDSVVATLAIVSERTNNKLRAFPTRLRRTLATRAAREGFGVLVIAELLDHSDTTSARIYTENVPEHVDAINEAVARQLAPLAQAFAGVVVNSENDAIRGDDLRSRVRCEAGGVGTCGNYGFCGALAPIACYTCKNFQPWIDGPHQDVLDSLINERERIHQLTQDKTMASINDRTILAVTQVIQICANRKQKIECELTDG